MTKLDRARRRDGIIYPSGAQRMISFTRISCYWPRFLGFRAVCRRAEVLSHFQMCL